MLRIALGMLLAMIVGGLAAGDVLARGGGRSFGGGGGGFSSAGRSFNPGGFSAGGGIPSAGSFANRAPQASRPAAPAWGGQAGAGSFAERNFGGASARPSLQSSQFEQRPSAGQLGNFLNMPQEPARGTFGAGAGTPSQLPSGGGTKTYTTSRGGTVTVGAGSGSTTTAGGATIGGAGAGMKLETAGGQTFVKGTGVAGATNGTQGAVAGGSVRGIEGAAGQGAVNARGGIATTSGYRAAGGVTGVQGRNGYAAVNARGAEAIGGVGRAGSISAVRGPGGNAIAAGRGASFVGGQFVGGHCWSAINGSFRHWNCFTAGWWGRYPGAWWPGRWAVATTAWAAASWATAGAYCGVTGAPMYYDYSDNVAYDNGVVYYGDQAVASADQYYNQAAAIAANGQSSQDDQWMPLGVFGVVASDDQTNTDKIIQLAVNKDGAIRGNYEDLLTEQVTPITGAVDKQTQRVALRLASNDSLLVETGLYNLTNDEVPVLIHAGPDRQESRTLIRLKDPSTDPASAPQPQ
jgi:hypothetical protein